MRDFSDGGGVWSFQLAEMGPTRAPCSFRGQHRRPAERGQAPAGPASMAGPQNRELMEGWLFGGDVLQH